MQIGISSFPWKVTRILLVKCTYINLYSHIYTYAPIYTYYIHIFKYVDFRLNSGEYLKHRIACYPAIILNKSFYLCTLSPLFEYFHAIQFFST